MTNSTAEQISREIVAYIRENLFFSDDGTFNADTSLLGSGILDSTSVLELVTWIEKEHAIQFLDTDLNARHFESASTIAHLVAARVASSHADPVGQVSDQIGLAGSAA